MISHDAPQLQRNFLIFRGILIFFISTIISSIILHKVEIPKASEVYKKLLNFKLLNTPSNIIVYNNCTVSSSSPTFAIYNESPQEDHLKHVLEILTHMGLQRVSIEDDWDLLWSHNFPFRIMSSKLKNLKIHQKVNHYPGCGFLTSKVHLSTTNLQFLPKAFKLPENKIELIKYKKENPEKYFVEKHNEHRHIYIKSINEINLDSNDSFVQEYIDRPFLVDGYKFDVGVYVIITSIDPLRVYIYTGEVLFRYCTVKYYPFNASDINKYVVGDDYLPTWEVPSLKIYYNDFKFGMKDSFDAYVKYQNHNPKLIWLQVEKIIRETILAKENNIIDILKAYKTKNFFELMRFDLIINEDLKVYLMEANMSPNLSSAHFKQNSLLYQQLLYSMFQLLGVGSPLTRENFQKRNNEIESIISSDKNIAINSELCFKNACHKYCNLEKCKLCLSCFNKNTKQSLHDAYREHIHRADTKRIFPTPIINLNKFNIEEEIKLLSAQNKLISQWFYEKCRIESTWCT